MSDGMNEEEKKLDLRALLEAARRRRRPMIITALSCLAITLLLVLFLPAYYRSSGIILIEQQELPAELVRSTVTSYADQRVQTISQRVMTTQNLLRIIERYDLYPNERQRDTREELIAKMRKDIKLDMISADVIDPRSGMPRAATIAFSVSYTSRSTDKAMRVANELTTLFLNENITERTRLAQDASTFLSDESNRVSGHIGELESKLAAFKEKNGDSLPELAQMNMTMLDRTEQELRQQEAHRMSLEQQRVYLEAQLVQIKPNSAMTSDSGERILTPADRLKALRSQMASLRARYGNDHPDIARTQREIDGLISHEGTGGESAANDLMRRLDDARLRLAESSKKYAPEHPDIVRGQREVASLEADLAKEQARPVSAAPVVQPDNPAYIQLQAQLSATKNDIEGTESQVAQLKKQMNDYQRKISMSPQVEKEYRELARDYQNSQAKYQELRAKQMEAQVAQNLEADRKGERFTLIEPPMPPEEPVSPNRLLIWLIGIVMSAGLAVGCVALLESLDATVRNRKDLFELLAGAPIALVPVIGTSAEAGQVRTRVRYALGAVAVAAVSAILAVHLLYRPVDVLWFQVLRKFGM
jgi:succinoglycan biosynthesis transport protein ExoP